MSIEEKQPVSARPAARHGDVLDGITFAAFDLDSRIFRTLWHSLVRTPDVALAAVEGDFSRYLSPVRVFIALFGFQFVVAALFGTPLMGTLEQLTLHVEPDAVAAWLATGTTAEGGTPTAGEIDRALENWGSVLLWPIMAISALPYLVLLKLYRWRVPLWAHVQFYLVPANASFILMIAAIPVWLIGDAWFLVAVLPGMLVYFVGAGWLIARFYSRSALGTTLRLGGLILMLPLVAILVTIGQFLSILLILDLNFDLSLARLFLLDNT